MGRIPRTDTPASPTTPRRPREVVQNDRDRLLVAVCDADGVKTRDLAGIGSRPPYGDLSRMRELGLVESRKVTDEDKTLYFCVDHEAVLNESNYEEHKGDEIRPFHPKVAEWRATAAGRHHVQTLERVAA